MFVKIFKLEDEEETLATFPQGTHVIGRGTELQCNDKRVSRNHATLEITGENVTLTSIHINPCFLRTANSKTITILAKDSSTQLGDGDAFAFLPHEFWFKIKICEDITNPVIVKEEENTTKEDLKRCLSDPEQGTSEKKIKVENGDSMINSVKKEETKKNDENNAELNHELHIIDEPNIKQEENSTTNPTNNNLDDESNNQQNAQDTVVGDENKEEMGDQNTCPESVSKPENMPTSDQGASSSSDKREEAICDETAAGTSKVKSRRERCWYAEKCYRKNPQHRDDFSHPGDSDFESDPEDDRPSCSFGAACYRKNKEHRRNYKHPQRKPPSEKTAKRIRKKVDRLNVADYDDLSDLSDDPFAADGDSDEYVEDTDSDDTDWEDSQNVDEDSENVRRMVKEAKQFMKK